MLVIPFEKLKQVPLDTIHALCWVFKDGEWLRIKNLNYGRGIDLPILKEHVVGCLLKKQRYIMTDESDFEATPQQTEMFNPVEMTGEDTLTTIRILSGQLDEMDSDVAALEVALKEAKQVRKTMAEVTLPEIMNSIGMADFTMNDGKKVKLTTFYDAKIKNKLQAFSYLESVGDQSIIKDTVTLNFERGDHEQANTIVDELTTQGVALKRKEDVHPSTLKAYVKEKLESGANIPMEAFGVYIGNRVTIK